jgi:hypothetical protein
MDRAAWELRSAEFVTRLIDLQLALGDSDRDFAGRLDIAQPTWTRTRLRQIPVGLALLQGVGAAFPEYSADILTLFRRSPRGRRDAPEPLEVA